MRLDLASGAPSRDFDWGTKERSPHSSLAAFYLQWAGWATPDLAAALVSRGLSAFGHFLGWRWPDRGHYGFVESFG
jgi:neutral trehalase